MAVEKQSGPHEGVRKPCISAAIYHLREKRMVCLRCKKTLSKCNLNNTRPLQHNEKLCKEVVAAASPPPTNKEIKAGAATDDTQLESCIVYKPTEQVGLFEGWLRRSSQSCCRKPNGTSRNDCGADKAGPKMESSFRSLLRYVNR